METSNISYVLQEKGQIFFVTLSYKIWSKFEINFRFYTLPRLKTPAAPFFCVPFLFYPISSLFSMKQI